MALELKGLASNPDSATWWIWLWATYFTELCLSLFSYKMEMLAVPTLRDHLNDGLDRIHEQHPLVARAEWTIVMSVSISILCSAIMLCTLKA